MACRYFSQFSGRILRQAYQSTQGCKTGLLGSPSQSTCCRVPSLLASQFTTSSQLAGTSTTQHGEKAFSTALAVQDDWQPSSDVMNKLNTQLVNAKTGRLFAVVHASGKQRKITTEDIIILDKYITADVGDRIRLNKVLLVGGKDFTLVGTPVLSPDVVKVEATVIEKTLDFTKIIFNYHRRRNYRMFKLRRQRLTYLRINSIEVNSLDSENESTL